MVNKQRHVYVVKCFYSGNIPSTLDVAVNWLVEKGLPISQDTNLEATPTTSKAVRMRERER
jgi:hypothetical protein